METPQDNSYPHLTPEEVSYFTDRDGVPPDMYDLASKTDEVIDTCFLDPTRAVAVALQQIAFGQGIPRVDIVFKN